MEFLQVIKKRRSARKYLPNDIPDHILNEILEVGRFAPSGSNEQNYFFGVIKDKQQKEKLSNSAGGQEWIASAPVIIAYCSRITKGLAELSKDDYKLIVNKTRFGEDLISYLSKYKDPKAMGTFLENCNPLIPGEHIFLAAINFGLNACWIGHLDIKKASEILNLPSNIVCLFLMPIGYAKEIPKNILKKSQKEIVFYDEWNNI